MNDKRTPGEEGMTRFGMCLLVAYAVCFVVFAYWLAVGM